MGSCVEKFNDDILKHIYTKFFDVDPLQSNKLHHNEYKIFTTTTEVKLMKKNSEKSSYAQRTVCEELWPNSSTSKYPRVCWRFIVHREKRMNMKKNYKIKLKTAMLCSLCLPSSMNGGKLARKILI
jgi:hypothetical protein